VFGKEVQVFGSKLDRYGRYVGTVVIDGTDVNLQQLRAGMAWYYVNTPPMYLSTNGRCSKRTETEAGTAKRCVEQG
jgi:endonuclease YncB( thermonuclease family)